jgi:tetratricopeptide (TPR) repeat protein
VAASCLCAEALLRLDRNERAFDVAREAHTQAMRHGTWIARAAELRGVAARRAGQMLEARESFDAAVAACAGDVPPRLALEHAVCHIAFDGANPALEATLANLMEADDGEVAHGALAAAFDLAIERRDADGAAALLSRSSPRLAEHDRLAMRARLALATGDAETAQSTVEQLTALSDSADHGLLSADVQLATGDAARAVVTLDTWVEMGRATGNPTVEGAALGRRSFALALLGDTEAAGADALRALELAQARFAPAAYATAAHLLVASQLEREMVDRALDQLDEAVAWLERTGAATRALLMTAFEATVQLETTGQPELPGDHEALLRHGTTVGNPKAAAIAHLSLARLAHSQGDARAAQDHLGSAKALDNRSELGLHDLIRRLSTALGLEAGSA